MERKKCLKYPSKQVTIGIQFNKLFKPKSLKERKIVEWV